MSAVHNGHGAATPKGNDAAFTEMRGEGDAPDTHGKDNTSAPLRCVGGRFCPTPDVAHAATHIITWRSVTMYCPAFERHCWSSAEAVLSHHAATPSQQARMSVTVRPIEVTR